jgi:hypothetical protein
MADPHGAGAPADQEAGSLPAQRDDEYARV